MPIAKYLLDITLPPRCPGCGIVQLQDNALCQKCWEDVNFITDPQCNLCGLPFEINVTSENKCASCLTHPPAFDKARAVFVYNDASKRLVLNLKHGDRLDIVGAISGWMMRVGSEFFEEDAPIIIPVPLHRRRLFKRRFNQAGEISKSLSKKSGVSVELDLLKRIKNTIPQGYFSAAKRRKNVTGAFAIDSKVKYKLKNRNIILLDDVITTGATAGACSKVLKNAGAAQVHVLCLARVAKPLISLN